MLKPFRPKPNSKRSSKNIPIARWLPRPSSTCAKCRKFWPKGNFRVASFYYTRDAYRAAGARLIELTNRYPLYSQADQANWMLGQIYEKSEHNDIAAKYYSANREGLSAFTAGGRRQGQAGEVRRSGSSGRSDGRGAHAERTNRLTGPDLIKRSMGVLKTGPDVSTAAHNGAPTMTPASEIRRRNHRLRTAAQRQCGCASEHWKLGHRANRDSRQPRSAAPSSLHLSIDRSRSCRRLGTTRSRRQFRRFEQHATRDVDYPGATGRLEPGIDQQEKERDQETDPLLADSLP